MSNTDYQKTLPLASTIVDKILYPDGIKSHTDYANRINKIADVNKILMNNPKFTH